MDSFVDDNGYIKYVIVSNKRIKNETGKKHISF